jgi:hypothetical protein
VNKRGNRDDAARLARLSRRAGEPVAVCPKCKKFVSPHERLAVHFGRCGLGRRSILGGLSDGVDADDRGSADWFAMRVLCGNYLEQ